MSAGHFIHNCTVPVHATIQHITEGRGRIRVIGKLQITAIRPSEVQCCFIKQIKYTQGNALLTRALCASEEHGRYSER